MSSSSAASDVYKRQTKTSVPLALKMVRGKIPEYYASGTNGPAISVPIN